MSEPDFDFWTPEIEPDPALGPGFMALTRSGWESMVEAGLVPAKILEELQPWGPPESKLFSHEWVKK